MHGIDHRHCENDHIQRVVVTEVEGCALSKHNHVKIGVKKLLHEQKHRGRQVVMYEQSYHSQLSEHAKENFLDHHRREKVHVRIAIEILDQLIEFHFFATN